VRSPAPVFTHEAHTSALSALAFSPSVAGCLVTVSSDRLAKVWDVRSYSSADIVCQRQCKIGEIHCAAACPDEPLLFCVGGEFEMKLLDFHHDAAVTEKFSAESGAERTETPSDRYASNIRGSNRTSEKLRSVAKSRKTKISDANLSSTSTVSASSQSNGTDQNKLEKTKQLVSISSDSKSRKPKRLNTKHKKDTQAQT